ncbi:MAG: response regulator [Myxococcota bacterium]
MTTPSILVVDDEALVVEAIRRTLRKEGFRLLTAPSGAAALEVLARESVDILISDIDMPEMSGLELLRKVRVQWPAVVRIVLTGGFSLESAVTAINEGEVHRYLTKPWTNEVLVETMRATVARLDALRASVQVEALGRAQELLRRELAAAFPGILDVAREGDAYVLDDERLLGLLRELDEPTRARLAASALDAADDLTRVVPDS